MMSGACLRTAEIDFSLTSEQQVLRDMLRSFVAKEVRPRAHDWDVTGKFPAETVAKLGALGIMGAMVPEEYGGAGMDTVSYAIAVSEIAGDSSLSLRRLPQLPCGPSWVRLRGRRKYLGLPPDRRRPGAHRWFGSDSSIRTKASG
jgi:alkylation response protein AidB-like acyl-CoA dehydrogenase